MVIKAHRITWRLYGKNGGDPSGTQPRGLGHSAIKSDGFGDTGRESLETGIGDAGREHALGGESTLCGLAEDESSNLQEGDLSLPRSSVGKQIS